MRTTATFLALDGALGEDGVERWMGSVEAAADAPAGARPIAELRAATDALAKAATGEKLPCCAVRTVTGGPSSSR